jgi:hypothetical protein
MVRQSPSRPSILQAKRPPQSIANPGDHDGKDEDRRYAILAGCPELAASAFWGRLGIGGWVLIRPPDCPNDPTHRTLATDVVRTLACRYSDSSVVIDTATVTPHGSLTCRARARRKGLQARTALASGHTGRHRAAPRRLSVWRPRAEAEVMARSVRIHLASTPGSANPALLQANPWP